MKQAKGTGIPLFPGTTPQLIFVMRKISYGVFTIGRRSIFDAMQREVSVATLSFFCFAWLIFLGALSCLHSYLAMSNITTNEQVRSSLQYCGTTFA
jgi:hypothetical protein